MENKERNTYRAMLIPGILACATLFIGILFFFQSPSTWAPSNVPSPSPKNSERVDEAAIERATLKIETGDEVFEYFIEVSEESTVADMFDRAMDEHGLSVGISELSFGLFVTSIAGIPDENTTDGYWMFSINDSPSPVGISEAKVNSGDIVTWTFGQ